MEIEITIKPSAIGKHLDIHGQTEDKSFTYICEIVQGDRAVLIKNYTLGVPHIAHPNMDRSGDVDRMRKEGGWGTDKVIEAFGGYVNLDKIQIEHPLDALAWWLELNGKHDLEFKKLRLSLQHDGTPSVQFIPQD
jgi:hypothetical protein